MTLLEKRITEHSIPEFEEQMVFDNVAIYRLDQEEQTVGGLFIPETARDYKNRGVLISAGLKALDELGGEGIDLGHVVSFGRFAGDEKMVERSMGTSGKTVLICKSRDVTSSADLKQEIKAKTKVVRIDEDEQSDNYGKHYIEEA